MNLENYYKIGIIGALVITGTFTFHYALEIQNSIFDYNLHRTFKTPMHTDAEKSAALQKIQNHPSYDYFLELHPDALVEVYKRESDVRVKAFAFNKDLTGVLRLDYDVDLRDHEEVTVNVHCDIMHRKQGVKYHAEGPLVIPFLNTTECLK